MPDLTGDRAKYNRAASRQRQERAAHQAWKEGRVRPFVIIDALNARQLDGPLVDAACGTCEPAVDEWEAGQLYPTWDELKAMADLTDYPVAFFTIVEHWPLRAQDTSLRFHARVEPEPEPVPCFEPEAIWVVTGTSRCPWCHRGVRPALPTCLFCPHCGAAQMDGETVRTVGGAGFGCCPDCGGRWPTENLAAVGGLTEERA